MCIISLWSTYMHYLKSDKQQVKQTMTSVIQGLKLELLSYLYRKHSGLLHKFGAQNPRFLLVLGHSGHPENTTNTCSQKPWVIAQESEFRIPINLIAWYMEQNRNLWTKSWSWISRISAQRTRVLNTLLAESRVTNLEFLRRGRSSQHESYYDAGMDQTQLILGHNFGVYCFDN